MTVKELLESVSFDDMVPYLLEIRFDEQYSMSLFKNHYDWLRTLEPKPVSDNDENCYVFLDDQAIDFIFFNPEIEYALSEEIEFESGIKSSNAELAAYCLNATTNLDSSSPLLQQYLINESRDYCSLSYCDTFDKLNCYRKLVSNKFDYIKKNGGYTPRIGELTQQYRKELKKKATQKMSIFNGKRKIARLKRIGEFRKKLMEEFYFDMWIIGSFIERAIPFLSDARNKIDIKQLCRLFFTDGICVGNYTSYTDDKTDSAENLIELIEKYDALVYSGYYLSRGEQPPKFERIFVLFTVGDNHNVLTDSDLALCNSLRKGFKSSDIVFVTDPSLGKQIDIQYLLYNSKEPLVNVG